MKVNQVVLFIVVAIIMGCGGMVLAMGKFLLFIPFWIVYIVYGIYVKTKFK